MFRPHVAIACACFLLLAASGIADPQSGAEPAPAQVAVQTSQAALRQIATTPRDLPREAQADLQVSLRELRSGLAGFAECVATGEVTADIYNRLVFFAQNLARLGAKSLLQLDDVRACQAIAKGVADLRRQAGCAEESPKSRSDRSGPGMNGPDVGASHGAGVSSRGQGKAGPLREFSRAR